MIYIRGWITPVGSCAMASRPATESRYTASVARDSSSRSRNSIPFPTPGSVVRIAALHAIGVPETQQRKSIAVPFGNGNIVAT